MILVGNQRGGARDLAYHLMKDDNERVVVHEIRGFASDNLQSAFQESYAVSRGTRCKQHLYSLSLNPPKDESVPTEVFVDALNQAEQRLSLSGQPRAVVFHEKRGSDGEIRRHAHAVWCRIDVEKMRAVQMSYDRPKLNALGRELYIEHGWRMPRGFVRHQEPNPRNYTLAEWQQAKRAGRDPAKLKAMIQDCWAISDSKASFASALSESGFILARGDKRGAVAVDHCGEAFPIGRAIGIKSKQIKNRLGDLEALPSRDAAHRKAALLIVERLKELQADQQRIAHDRLRQVAAQRRITVANQDKEAEGQRQVMAERIAAERATTQSQIRVGWRGLLDRITGRRRRIESESRERVALAVRQAQERQASLSKTQAVARKHLEEKAAGIKTKYVKTETELRADVQQIARRGEFESSIESKARGAARDAFKAERRRAATSGRQKRRSNAPDYSRNRNTLSR